MKIPSLKNNFDREILERGYDYYKEGRIKNLIVDGKKVKAVVIGNRNYRVAIDLAKNNFKCTCPCDFNCKHAAAVLYELRENNEVETVDNLKSKLNKKSKEELAAILQKILISEPRFKKLLSNKPEEAKKEIKSLDLDYDEDIDKFTGEVDELFDLINEQENRLENLILLFKKCFEIYKGYGYDFAEPLEDSMFRILSKVSKEAKKLPKNKRQSLIQELVDLTRGFDFFWDSIDDRGINIKF
jgi:uncharacterized Zn finger protein